jgi:hypothetical protein
MPALPLALPEGQAEAKTEGYWQFDGFQIY